MQYIRLPDGSTAEFPDYLSDQEIEDVLQREFPSERPTPRTPETQTFLDAVQPERWTGLGEDLLRTGRDVALEVPKTIYGAVEAGATFLTGLSMFPVGGLAQIAGLIAKGDVESAERWGQKVAELGTYMPRTEYGAIYAEKAGELLEMPAKAVRAIGGLGVDAMTELQRMYPKLTKERKERVGAVSPEAFMAGITTAIEFVTYGWLFRKLHGVFPKDAAKKLGPKAAKEFETFMKEEAAIKLGREEKAAILRAARKRKLPADFIKELEKVEPIERAAPELYEGPRPELPREPTEVMLRKAWQAIEAKEPKEIVYKRKGRVIPIEELKEPPAKVTATFKGWRPTGDHFAIYNIEGGKRHGSTVVAKTLKAEAIEIPKTPEKPPRWKVEEITPPEPKIKPPVKEKVEKVAEPIPKPKEVKEAWEMNYADYHNRAVDLLEKEAPDYYKKVFLHNIENQKAFRKQSKSFHKKAVQQAISEGKITSHPDYPELGKVVKEPTVAELKKGAIREIPLNDITGLEPQPRPVPTKKVAVTKPVELVFTDQGDLILEAGNHRYHQAVFNRDKTIPAKIRFEKGSEALWDKRIARPELGKAEVKAVVPPTKPMLLKKVGAAEIDWIEMAERNYYQTKSGRMCEDPIDFKTSKSLNLEALRKLKIENPQTIVLAKFYSKTRGGVSRRKIKVKNIILPSREAMVETFGFQRAYEWLDDVKKGREIKVREKVKKIRQDYLTPVEGNPLDKGAVAFLKSEKYPDYIKEMPAIGELSPKEIFRYDPVAKTLIATIETKEGNLKPAIRQSGYHALKEFADSFEGARDISKLSPSWVDPTRMIQELDQGRWGGMAQKHILWPSRMTTLSKLRFQDMRKLELNNIAEKYDIKSGKKAKAVGDIIEYVNTERAKLPAEWLLKLPEIQRFLKKFKPEVKAQLVEASKDLRIFADKLLDAQNIARKARKQKEIPYRVFYRPWIMETNLWSKLIGQKIRPEEIMERPEMPDFIFPNQPFNPRAEARTGLMAKYPKERNIVRLMNDYIDTAGKDIFDTNVVHNNKIHSAVLRSKGLENAAEGINRWTSQVFAGIDPLGTKWAKQVMPPVGRKAMLKIRRNLTRAVFPLNWTWNLFIQTSSAGITFARYGTKANVAGLRYFFSPKMHRAVKENAYSHIIKSRWGGKAHYQDIQNSISKNKRLEARPIEKAEDFLNYLTSTIESGLTGHAVAAAEYHGRVKLGLKGRELWEYASEGGSKTQSMYNYGDVPGMLRTREVGAIAPFQTFSFEVFNTVREMNFPVLRRLIGKTGLYETLSANSVAGKALWSNRLKMLARWTAAIIVTDTVGETAIGRKPWVVSSFIPFIGYLVGGYAGRGPVPHQYIQDAKAGIRDVLVYGDFGRLRKWLLRYQIIAGVQINRMMDGMEAVAKGGRVTDVRERTLFRIPPEEYLKAIAMGPYRTEEGKAYIKKRKEARSILQQLQKKKKRYQTIR